MPELIDTIPKTKCTGCWEGNVYRINKDVYVDCDVCGLPGLRPSAYTYVFEGRKYVISYYVNHGNTWQGYTVGVAG